MAVEDGLKHTSAVARIEANADNRAHGRLGSCDCACDVERGQNSPS